MTRGKHNQDALAQLLQGSDLPTGSDARWHLYVEARACLFDDGSTVPHCLFMPWNISLSMFVSDRVLLIAEPIELLEIAGSNGLFSDHVVDFPTIRVLGRRSRQ